MIEYIDINKIKPAEYNPRIINDEQIEELKKSINELGFVIPILVNKKNNVIIAGHQRTKTAKLCGLKKVPVIYIESIVIGDEIKFNQIHNAIDKSLNNSAILLKEYEKEKFIEINNEDFSNEQAYATIVSEICKLILKYGNVLSCVISKNKVVYGNEYVKACKCLNIKVNAYIVEDKKFDKILHFLNEEYGKYYYGAIERKTFVQGLAQLSRSVTKKEGLKQYKSVLYTEKVLPYLFKQDKKISILDFGCGKGAYISEISKTYKNAIGLEFYNNTGKQINVSKGNAQINKLIEFLKTSKNFDIVVCDSVLNSVDSVEAEKSVLTCLNFFAKDIVFLSGRTKEATKISKDRKGTVAKNFLTFLDDNYFTSTYRQGQWYFQHFHTKEYLLKILNENGFEVVDLNFNKFGGTFQVECKKVKELSKEEYIKAIDFEFNLPLPNNKTYNRQNDIKKVLGLM